MGEESAELGADPKFELLPTLLANIFLILGVRAIGLMGMLADFEGFRFNSEELRAVVFVLAAVTV